MQLVIPPHTLVFPSTTGTLFLQRWEVVSPQYFEAQPRFRSKISFFEFKLMRSDFVYQILRIYGLLLDAAHCSYLSKNGVKRVLLDQSNIDTV